jgi:hypothetical protein
MPFTQYMNKAVLDFTLGGATPTRPGNRWVSWATGSPNEAGASDAGQINSRQSWDAAAANSPQGSVTNRSTGIGATATAACTIVGWNLWDASVGGTRLAYGTLSASVGVASANSVRIGVGSMKIVIS